MCAHVILPLYYLHCICIAKGEQFFISIKFPLIQYKRREHYDLSQMLGLVEYSGINDLAHIGSTNYVSPFRRLETALLRKCPNPHERLTRDDGRRRLSPRRDPWQYRVGYRSMSRFVTLHNQLHLADETDVWSIWLPCDLSLSNPFRGRIPKIHWAPSKVNQSSVGCLTSLRSLCTLS